MRGLIKSILDESKNQEKKKTVTYLSLKMMLLMDSLKISQLEKKTNIKKYYFETLINGTN